MIARQEHLRRWLRVKRNLRSALMKLTVLLALWISKMSEPVTLFTDRLRLRPWRESDREPFAALNADPVVMEFFPSTLTQDQSNAMVDRIQAVFAERGWGLWAVDFLNSQPADENHLSESQRFILENQIAGTSESPHQFAAMSDRHFVGYVGLAVPRFEATFTPCVEIGWRLARSAWGHGIATEAARAVCRYAFETLQLDEIVSFTSVNNGRSRKVMQRIGMRRDCENDFDHPTLPVGNALRRHVLYRLANPGKGE
jgi:RimJ/RimL family protein N-acetyltransferase